MTSFLAQILVVSLLSNLEPVPQKQIVHAAPPPTRIRSRSLTYDLQENIALLQGTVSVEERQNRLASDSLYLFLTPENTLLRAVALGDVDITAGARSGTCPRAVYRRAERRIEMYGSDGRRVRLSDGGANASHLEGNRIALFLDSEHVEVDDPVVRTVPKRDTALPLPN